MLWSLVIRFPKKGLNFNSCRAQAQSAVAASVADEAFGNIRTVRAFAMEELESRLVPTKLR